MMYQDGSVSKNVKYQELCTDIFRETSKLIESVQWQAYTYISIRTTSKNFFRVKKSVFPYYWACTLGLDQRGPFFDLGKGSFQKKQAEKLKSREMKEG